MTASDPRRASPPRVVLDTNVCLDLFVFADPHCARLEQALRAGTVEAVTCTDCEQEWRAVLAYPQLALDEAARVRAMAAFEARVRRLRPTAAGPARLPRCADPDDQKFLVLAARAGARWLLSRDSALLELHRRCLRHGGFGVLTPQAWIASAPDACVSAGRDAGRPVQGLSAKPV
ncbi:putative toxin-antitoxin system toxin component, PIN family [Frateuria sp. STR12]|uniref:putative toxin-antitoxin system toxin component, PIN family n=1 Tax=Frateuria hangzhouensis TaxID=2995589 RepID=UPI0022608C71|nr:putative toxin-antitoxin system toxin component, PIN family [Frateuria sp. STR12]MCX7514628.1 putative toxin-antitoxin system toxin component, PIN family [Frateuria sp. STR12]